MNARQVAAILNARQLPAEAVDATELIVTDGHHGGAKPLITETESKAQVRLEPVLSAERVALVTGFIAATVDGVPTTLGRGGSDYTATILGRALNADEIWIWTDVNGVMTTDPRIVPNARTIPQLSFVEVGELAYFGAKVLHPRAIRPARQANIPVRMLNTFEPDNPGTLITDKIDREGHVVKAISAIKDLSLITIAGTGMMGIPGVAGRTFSAVAKTGSSVLMISQSSSEQSICFVVDSKDVALGKAGVNVIAIAQGSSEYNISLVIAQGEADTAVRLIHDEFHLYE